MDTTKEEEYNYNDEECPGCETGCDADSPHKITTASGKEVFHPNCCTKAAEEARYYEGLYIEDKFQLEAEKRNTALIKKYGKIKTYALWRAYDIEKEDKYDTIIWWQDFNKTN